MSLPKPITLQSGYRKEIVFVDQDFWESIPATFRSAWGLDINLKVFDRNATKITGSFIVEATSGLRVLNIKNQLIGQLVKFIIVSNSEKIFHKWTSMILDIVSIEENSASTAFYSYKITCEFSLPMAEESINGSFVDHWWETC